MENEILEVVLFAVGGGLAPMLIELCDYDAGRRQQKKRILTLNCWLAFLLRPLLAAGLALAYIRSGIVLSPIVAVNIGVAAPLILKAMLRAGPGR